MDKKRLLKITERISDFPTLPGVIARVMQVMDDPNSSASDLTDLIKLDQAMMFRILKMANSAYYGFPRSIATITESIVLLGFTTVRNIILTTMMYQFDQLWKSGQGKSPGRESYFDQKKEWAHAVATAIASRELIILQHQMALENFGYLAGLMHDIGKVLFFQYMQEEYQPVLKVYSCHQRPLWELELKMIGAHHGQVGSWIVDRWNLPEDIVAPIANHHSPEIARDHLELTWALHFADYIAHEALQDKSFKLEDPGWQTRLENFISIDREGQTKLIEKVREELQLIESYMELE